MEMENPNSERNWGKLGFVLTLILGLIGLWLMALAVPKEGWATNKTIIQEISAYIIKKHLHWIATIISVMLGIITLFRTGFFKNILHVEFRNDFSIPANIGETDLKLKTKILIIDDNKPSEILEYMKDAGWKVKYLNDLDNMNNYVLCQSHIIFIDIMGPGKKLSLNDGQELAVEIKKKYPGKKVAIYSTVSEQNIFHEAIDVVDKRIRRQGTLIPFVSAIEEMAAWTFNYQDAVVYCFSKIKPLLPPTISFEKFNTSIQASISSNLLNLEKLSKSANISIGTSRIVSAIMQPSIERGA